MEAIATYSCPCLVQYRHFFQITLLALAALPPTFSTQFSTAYPPQALLITLPMLCPFFPRCFTAVQQPGILLFSRSALLSPCCGLRDFAQMSSAAFRTLDHLIHTLLMQFFHLSSRRTFSQSARQELRTPPSVFGGHSSFFDIIFFIISFFITFLLCCLTLQVVLSEQGEDSCQQSSLHFRFLYFLLLRTRRHSNGDPPELPFLMAAVPALFGIKSLILHGLAVSAGPTERLCMARSAGFTSQAVGQVCWHAEVAAPVSISKTLRLGSCFVTEHSHCVGVRLYPRRVFGHPAASASEGVWCLGKKMRGRPPKNAVQGISQVSLGSTKGLCNTTEEQTQTSTLEEQNNQGEKNGKWTNTKKTPPPSLPKTEKQKNDEKRHLFTMILFPLDTAVLGLQTFLVMSVRAREKKRPMKCLWR